uniref:G-protein coupled receptors family 1 profile domain-containing protein n=1 Tax=Caenorhabditis japonica TaxID=281687 RepID=A0A8R1DLK8_CAEJA
MNILMAWFLFQWFEAIVAKLVILPYQMGLIVIGVERKKTFYSWWSEDAESIVNVEDKDEMWPLDYESVPRRHIPLILILLTNSITIPYAYLLINNHISFTFASGQCFVNSAMVFFGYLLLWRVNVEMRNRLVSKRLGNKKDKYSLAKKFQIEENIRSLVVAKRLVIAAVIYLAVSLGMLFYFVFGSRQSFHTLFAYILDNIIFS